MFLFRFMQNVVFHRHVRIVFLLNQPIATVLSYCPSMTLTIGHFEHSYWLTWEKYNTHVTMKDHIFA
jgi:hypothetical protein